MKKTGFLRYELNMGLLMLLFMLLNVPGFCQENSANFVILSYDISASMAYKYIPKEYHERINDYLKKMLVGGCKDIVPASGDEFAVKPVDEALAKPLLVPGSGYSIIHFGKEIAVKSEIDDLAKSPVLDLFYPTAFPDQNTAMEGILKRVGEYATREAATGRQCFWIFVSDNIDDVGGIGGGSRDEAFLKFANRYYHKPVFVIKIPTNKKNYQGKPAFAFVTVARVIDVENIAQAKSLPMLDELEAALNQLEKDEILSHTALFKNLRNLLATLKVEINDVQNSVEKLNAVQDKITTIKRGIEELYSIKKLWEDLQRARVRMSELEKEDINKHFTKDFDEVATSIKSLEVDFSIMDKDDIQVRLNDIEKRIATIEGLIKGGIQVDFEKLKQLEIRCEELEKQASPAHAAGLGNIRQELKQLRGNFDKLTAGERLTGMESIGKKLDEIAENIRREKYSPYFERLALILKDIEALQSNNDASWTATLDSYKKEAESYQNTLYDIPYEQVPPLLGDLADRVKRIPRGDEGILLLIVLFGVAFFGFLYWYSKKNEPVMVRLEQIIDGNGYKPAEFRMSTDTIDGTIKFTTDTSVKRSYPLDAPKYVLVRTIWGVFVRSGGRDTPVEFGKTFSIRDSSGETTYTMRLSRMTSSHGNIGDSGNTGKTSQESSGISL